VARASYYRRAAPQPSAPKPRPTPARALADGERALVLAELSSPRFVDLAPREVYARLLDEGRYLCSIATMYRVLADAGEVRERRDVLRHPSYAKPELLATAPNQVWSWDITKLRGPRTGVTYCLYVVLDLYSRYVVGWMLAPTENGVLAGELIDEACAKQGILPGELTLHNDRGSPMKARSLAVTLAELGVLHSFSRPQISDDNPFSEAQFKTLKYMPGFPSRFASLDDARAFLRRFFAWYNHEHRHTGLNLHTPADVHDGRAAAVTAARQLVLDLAHAAHPERFVRKAPVAALPPAAAWINPPIDVVADPSHEARA
jgi:putative transposase